MKLFIPDKHDPIDSDDSSIGEPFIGSLNQNISEDEENDAEGEDDLSNEGDDDSHNSSNFDSELSEEDELETSDSNLGEKDLDLNSVKGSNGSTSDSVVEKEKDGEQLDKMKGIASEQNEGDEDKNDDDDDDCESTSSEEADATMQDIFGVKPNKEANRKHPPNFNTDSSVLDLCFHPESDLLATATIGGECIIYRHSSEKVEEVKRFDHHKKSCRQVCFNASGSDLYTVSKDKSIAIIDSSNSTIKSHIKGAHEAPIYSFYEIEDNIIATGDDDGTVKMWDLRRNGSVLDFKCGEDTVTSLLSCDKQRFLSATSSDGSLTGYHIRRKRIEAQSEMYSSEFTSQCLVNGETRLCVGSGLGIFYLFNWGDFGYNVDALAGHPELIQCQVAILDKIVLTGCEDGNIRAVHLYPHRFIGIIGQHKDFGVENIAVSGDGNLIATCSMDDVVQFWNIEYLYDIKQGRKMSKKRAVGINLSTSRKRNPKEFFNDIRIVVESDNECGPVPSTSYADSD